MIITANNARDALCKAKEIYNCDEEHLTIYTVKAPCRRYWGLFRKKGIYRVHFIEGIPKGPVKDSPEDGVDGYIEIINGKIKVTNPSGNGRYPCIAAEDPNVDIYINGVRVNGIHVVTEQDIIEPKPKVIEPMTSIGVGLSPDRMEAALTINRSPGKRYYLKDVGRNACAVISSGYKEILPEPVTVEQCIRELAKWGVKPRFINTEAIQQLADNTGGGSAVVAKGKKPVHGTDSSVRYLFERAPYRNPAFFTDGKVNLMEHTIIPTVNVGDVLAVKESPAIPGKNGETVTGEVIAARHGRDIRLIAGEGTALLENGKKIIAISSGRPVLEGSEVKVVPVLVVPRNADTGTGNIYFNGDIQIRGDVLDNIKVAAEGSIEVLGNVLNASLVAKEDIIIYGNVVSSKIIAGRGTISYLCVLPRIEYVLSVAEKLYKEVDKLTAVKCAEDVNSTLATLIYDNIGKIEAFVKGQKEMDTLFKFMTEWERDQNFKIISLVKSCIKEIRLHCNSIHRLEVLCRELDSYIEKVKDFSNKNVDVCFKFAQNSFVLANGTINITGQGCYHSNLIAKNCIACFQSTSIIRGGLLVAGRGMKLGRVGSPTGVRTYCKVIDKKGKIDAAHFYCSSVLDVAGRVEMVK